MQKNIALSADASAAAGRERLKSQMRKLQASLRLVHTDLEGIARQLRALSYDANAVGREGGDKPRLAETLPQLILLTSQ